MKFSLSVSNLLQCLDRVYGAISKGNKIDKALGCYTIEAQESGSLRIYGTDLEVSILTWTQAKIDEAATKLVNARLFHDAIKSLPKDKDVSFVMSGTMLALKCEKISFKFPTFTAGHGSIPEKIEGIETKQIDRGVMRDLIDRTLYAASQDDTRPNLAGVCFEPGAPGELRLIATDGHRLAVAEGQVGGVPQDFKPFLVPHKGCGEIRKLLAGTDEAEFGFDDKRIVIHSGDHTIMTCQLVESQFPEWKEVLPKITNKTATLDRQAVVEALGRLRMFSTKGTTGTKIELNGNASVVLKSNNPDLGSGEEEIPCEYEGDKLTIGFNGIYLFDACSSFDSEKIKLELSDANSPGVITDPENQNVKAVIMPMRI